MCLEGVGITDSPYKDNKSVQGVGSLAHIVEVPGLNLVLDINYAHSLFLGYS
jgi:hypothetical protein